MKISITDAYSAYPKTEPSTFAVVTLVDPGFVAQVFVVGGIVNTPHAEPRAEQNDSCLNAGCWHGGGATPIGCVAVSGDCNSVAHLELVEASSVSWWWEQ